MTEERLYRYLRNVNAPQALIEFARQLIAREEAERQCKLALEDAVGEPFHDPTPFHSDFDPMTGS